MFFCVFSDTVELALDLTVRHTRRLNFRDPKVQMSGGGGGWVELKFLNIRMRATYPVYRISFFLV